MSFFEQIKNNTGKNNVPVILIDISGSTNTKLNSKKQKKCVSGSTNTKLNDIKLNGTRDNFNALPNALPNALHNELPETIRHYEFKLAHDICTKNNYSRSHIICWSDVARLYQDCSTSKLPLIFEETKKISGWYTSHVWFKFNY